jgi:pimeloyl-ACP methyl ester carboxylesterase
VVREEVVRLGPRELVGIVTEPAQLAADASTFLFLNSGSEPHIGPGRAWVEYARALAAKGHAAVRVDFSGWGESPDLGHAPGRPYDPHGEQELIDIVEALQGRGYPQVVVVGLCAGAWIALRVASRRTMAGVVALNPQLYWRPGDPVEALMSETRARRTPDRRREERGRRLGIWTMLDVLRLRPSSARWLEEIDEAGTPTLLLFAEGDDGIEYLRNRCGRCLSRVLRGQTVRVAEIPGIDHSMHRVWLRDRVIDALADFSETLRQPTP